VSEPDKVDPEGAPRSAPIPAVPTHRPVQARPARWHVWAGWAALVVAVGSAAWVLPRLGMLETEATRRLQAADQRLVQLEAALGQAQSQLRDGQNRTAVVESKVIEAAGLQAQLEKLYRSLAEDSADVLLAEIESALSLSSQQLALGTSPQAALGALQEIEVRLAQQNDPSLGGVRRALLQDIDRLKAHPAADIAALALRLDGLLGAIDQYPLMSSVRPPAVPATAASAPGTAGSKASAGNGRPTSVGEATSRATDAAAAGLSALRDELQQLFRVRRIDTPDAALVAPEQAYFLRQNLRLLLLNARLALLSRNEALFRNDVERAVDWLRSYYDPEHRGVANAGAQLRQMMGARIALEAPTLAESLAAVRAARAARESRR